MTPETLTALRGSIAKWEAIVNGTGQDKGTKNCPLCQMFFNVTGNCDGCPVKESSGQSGCDGTPYDHYDRDMPEIAEEELEFLKSLLPEEAMT